MLIAKNGNILCLKKLGKYYDNSLNSLILLRLINVDL